MEYNQWLVLKIGSKSIVDAKNGYRIRTEVLDNIASDIVVAREMGWGVAIVSSGATYCGIKKMMALSRTLPDNQLYSTVGQTDMMHAWEEALEKVGLIAAQMVLTNRMLENEPRRSGIVSLIRRGQDNGVIYIINEDDAVVDDELKKLNDEGDNDKIGFNGARALGARILLMLTTVRGVFKTRRITKKNRPIPWIGANDEATQNRLKRWKGDSNGGMPSKVKYGQRHAQNGGVAHICHFDEAMPITRAIRGVHIGTIISLEEI